MNRKFKTLNILALSVISTGVFMTSCSNDPNSPGVEYMPDMYRSPAVEAYVDYGQILGRYSVELQEAYEPGLPPANVVPTSANSINDLPYAHGAPIGWDKSHGLYGAKFDSAGYSNAAADVNPIAYTEQIKKEAKEIYGNFCIHCHGEKGDGQGTVVTNGGYPPPPAYTSAALKDLPAGNIFYSITYGKGQMGSHASQLTKEERWKLVHHVELLQGKTKVTKEELAKTVSTDSTSTMTESAGDGEEKKGIIEKVVDAVEGAVKKDHSEH